MSHAGVLVLGATSTVARSLAARWAQEGLPLLLAGRDLPEIERVAADIRVRYGSQVEVVACDTAAAGYPEAVLASVARAGPLRGVLWAFGTMAGADGSGDAQTLRDSAWVNFGAAPPLIEGLLPLIDREGFIALLSSVAGDRGRQSNYVYGAAKAALGTYGLGLRHRLSGKGPSVTVVRLGVVDTRMTWGMNVPGGTADPDAVAQAVQRGIARRRAVVYAPRRWALVMAVIRNLPEPLFNLLRI